MDGTGSGSCAVAGFGVSGVEPSGSATRELILVKPFRSLQLCQPFPKVSVPMQSALFS